MTPSMSAVDNVSAPIETDDPTLPLAHRRSVPLYTRWSQVLLAGAPFANSRNGATIEDRNRPYVSAGPDLPPMQIEDEWWGTVESVDGDKVHVTLLDASGEEEFTEIDLAQVSPRDRPRVVPDAAFRWIIGHRDDSRGRRTGVSIIEFAERASPVSAEAREEALQAGEEVGEHLWRGVDTGSVFGKPPQ